MGRASSARFKTYERLMSYVLQSPLYSKTPEFQAIQKAIEQIGRFRLRESARKILNRQIKSGITDEQLSRLVTALYEENKLCVVHDEVEGEEPRIVCSLGLIA